MSNKVQNIYNFISAKWYDPFKASWNFLIAQKERKVFFKFLKENIDESKDILELGCGTALNLQIIHRLKLKYKSYLGLDFTESMLKVANKKFTNKPNIEFKRQDITKLGNIDEKYDTMLCTWVVSHLNDPVEFVNDAQKLLKPNGNFYLVFYTKPKWYLSFWFQAIAEHLFQAKSIDPKIIKKFKNVKSVKTSYSDLVTVVKINYII